MANVLGEILTAAQNGTLADVSTAIDQASGAGADTTANGNSPAPASDLSSITNLLNNASAAVATIADNSTVQTLAAQAAAPTVTVNTSSPTVNKAVAAASSPLGISTIALVAVAAFLILGRK